jgi:membrane-associated PAP2 superfamily phosphatase
VQNSYRRFISINTIGLILSGLLFAWIAHSGTFDFWLSQQFFDPVSQTFPLEHNRPLFFLGHTVLKKITVIGWMFCMVLAVASFWVQRLRPWRRVLITFVVMAGCTAQVVQSLKGASIHACPYDLAMYGGKETWFPLFDSITAAVHKGRCWPGGHASAGFGIIAGYFALREQEPRWARWALITGLVFGIVMGAVQVVRGAHFISHNLWSLWIVWAVCFAISLLINAAPLLKRHQAGVPAIMDPITAESVL